MASQTTRYVLYGAGGLVLLLLVIAGMLYLSDYGVEATIVDKHRRGGGYFVVAETTVGGVQVEREVSQTQYAAVQPGDIVVYHLRSGELEYHPKGGGLLGTVAAARDPGAPGPARR